MTENIQFLSTINKKKTSNSTTQHKIFQTHQPNLKKKPSPPKETTNYPYPRYPRRSPFFYRCDVARHLVLRPGIPSNCIADN